MVLDRYYHLDCRQLQSMSRQPSAHMNVTVLPSTSPNKIDLLSFVSKNGNFFVSGDSEFQSAIVFVFQLFGAPKQHVPITGRPAIGTQLPIFEFGPMRTWLPPLSPFDR